MITMMIGHNAIRNPSKDAVIQLINDSFHTVIARTMDTSREPNAALNVGHFSTINAKISQRIGLNPSMKCRKFIHTPSKTTALYNEYLCTGMPFSRRKKRIHMITFTMEVDIKKAGRGGVQCPKRKEKIIKNKNQESEIIFLTESSYRKVYESVTYMLKTEK